MRKNIKTSSEKRAYTTEKIKARKREEERRLRRAHLEVFMGDKGDTIL